QPLITYVGPHIIAVPPAHTHHTRLPVFKSIGPAQHFKTSIAYHLTDHGTTSVGANAGELTLFKHQRACARLHHPNDPIVRIIPSYDLNVFRHGNELYRIDRRRKKDPAFGSTCIQVDGHDPRCTHHGIAGSKPCHSSVDEFVQVTLSFHLPAHAVGVSIQEQGAYIVVDDHRSSDRCIQNPPPLRCEPFDAFHDAAVAGERFFSSELA